MRDGADGIEFDVRLSRDQVPVIIHDATLSRTANIARNVSDLSSQQLTEIEVGSWFNRKFPHLARPQYEEEKLPTLRNVFDLFSESAGQLYLEMKCEGSECEVLAHKCVELIQDYSFTNRLVVECFDLPAITHIKRLDSRIRTAALFEPPFKLPTSLLKRIVMVEKARDCEADEIAFHHRLISKRVIERARKLNILCVVWTVDRPRWFHRAASLGLKALITNNPATMFGDDIN